MVQEPINPQDKFLSVSIFDFLFPLLTSNIYHNVSWVLSSSLFVIFDDFLHLLITKFDFNRIDRFNYRGNILLNIRRKALSHQMWLSSPRNQSYKNLSGRELIKIETYLLVDVCQCRTFHAGKESAATSRRSRKKTGRRLNDSTMMKWVGIGVRRSDRNRRKPSSRVQVTADASGEKCLRAEEY